MWRDCDLDPYPEPVRRGPIPKAVSLLNDEPTSQDERFVRREKPKCPLCDYVEKLPGATEVRLHCEVRQGTRWNLIVVRGNDDLGVLCHHGMVHDDDS